MFIVGQTCWIDCELLSDFILKCQDADEGGISDRPGNMADIFHTFFGIAGLMLLHFFDGKDDSVLLEVAEGAVPRSAAAFESIDPTYALPVSVVKRLNLSAQCLGEVRITNVEG